MEDIKTAAADLHEKAAASLDAAAKLQRNAAQQCTSGNFEKAHSMAISAAEADTVANRLAMEAVDLYRKREEEVAEQKSEAAAEQAARDAKHAAKADE